jgi:hypothetical protein
MTPRAGLYLLLLSILGACTLLTSFNPDGQPCDLSASTVEKQCLTGFHCKAPDGKCVRDTDAGH